MLDVRSANLMDLAAGLPLEADRTDMRYQWITRLLGNPLVLSDGDHGAVRARGPGAGGRREQARRLDHGSVQAVGSAPGADAGGAPRGTRPAAGVAGRGDRRGDWPQHLSVQAYCPEWRKRQAQPHELDDATEPAGEPRDLAARHLFGLIG